MIEMSESRGLWKYMILLGAFIVNFLNTGTAKSFGVLIPALKHDFDTRVSILGCGIGMCHGLAVGLTFMSRPLLTKVTCRALTMIGGLVAGIGFCICSFSGTAVLFIIGIAIGGLGYSFMIISNVVIVKDYFTGSYSLALSFTFTGGAVGMMLIPVMTEKFADVYGWRGALLLVAALNFQNVAAGAVYRPLDSERESEFLLDKEQSNNTTNYRSRTSGTADIFNLRLMCDFPAINLVMIAALLSGATTTGWVAFLVPNGQIKGYPMNEAVLFATIGGFGNIFGRFFIGFTIGPRITARALFIVCNLICGVAFCLNYVTTTFWALSILSTMNGSTIGAMAVLVCLMIEEIVDDSRYASGVALAYFFLGIGEIFGGLFGGWIYDMTQNYDVAFIGLGCLNFLAALLTLLALSSCSRCRLPHLRS